MTVDTIRQSMRVQGKYRWRTWLRGGLPGRLGRLVPKGTDCGAHEWYRTDDRTWSCYHCEAGHARKSPWSPEEQRAHSLAALRALAEHPSAGSLPEMRRLVADAESAMRVELDEAQRLLRLSERRIAARA